MADINSKDVSLSTDVHSKMSVNDIFINSKPYVRWWWLNGPFKIKDIKDQLQWIRKNGFGGVEIAFIVPFWNATIIYPERITWLSRQFTDILTKTKNCAETLGLRCDFTFGSVWPFGGSFLAEEDRAQTFSGPSSKLITASWGSGASRGPNKEYVLNHLSKSAVENYFRKMIPHFTSISSNEKDHIYSNDKSHISSLFCDSFELDNNNIWTPELWGKFEKQYGYSLKDHIEELDSNNHIRYDTRKIISKTFVNNFCRTFTKLAQGANFRSRVQCHGAPADLISAYSAVDIPESECLLFPPTFSHIPASAATLTQKSIVSCECFTCLYGFVPPEETIQNEQIQDLKLIFDAVVSNGVNQIVWHGMPYNPLRTSTNYFYTSINVGPNSGFYNKLSSFNEYMENVCTYMRIGKNSHRLAIYLPNEDMMMLDKLPDDLCTPGAYLYQEMRYVVVPDKLRGYSPIWISGEILNKIEVKKGNLCCGDMSVAALYIDVKWLDYDAVVELLRIVNNGGHIIIKDIPVQPGFNRSNDYSILISELYHHPNSHRELTNLSIDPIIDGNDIPPFWCREDGSDLYIFLAHPATINVKYPLRYCQYKESEYEERHIKVYLSRHSTNYINLKFAPGDSVLLHVTSEGTVISIPFKSL
ncbi:Alpha-L-rhamnosidase [uncultured virus]|nr:Alpha-L-rhamnosidase [uncultured virus]